MSDREKKNIDLEKLLFDPQNPRLPKKLQGATDENKIIDYMVKYGNIIELMSSIAETNYSDAEPLLVTSNTKGAYIVIEGNRRLAALKLLNRPELTKIRAQTIKDVVSNAKYIPQEIPCILYSKREDVLDYLGYRHITGVKDWGALEKARYLDQLYQLHIEKTPVDQIYAKLAKMIGSRADYVSKLHTALKLYDKANNNAYYGADIQEEDISFSWFPTALGYKELVKYIGLSSLDGTLDKLNEDHYEKIFTWMFSPQKAVIKESRQISNLAKITVFPAAVERLDKGASIDEALLYTSAPSDAFISMLQEAQKKLKQAIETIGQLSEEPSDAMMLLQEIDKAVKTISGALKENFGDKDDMNRDILNHIKDDPKQLEELKKLLGLEK